MNDFLMDALINLGNSMLSFDLLCVGQFCHLLKLSIMSLRYCEVVCLEKFHSFASEFLIRDSQCLIYFIKIAHAEHTI